MELIIHAQPATAPGGVSLTYDEWDRVEEVGNGAGSDTYTYNPYGDLMAVTTDYDGAQPQTIEFEYTQAGGRNTLTLSDDRKILTRYDAFGRPHLVALTTPAGLVQRAATYTYDAAGKVASRLVYGPDPGPTPDPLLDPDLDYDPLLQTTYTYDTLGYLTELTHARKVGNNWVTLTTFSNIAHDDRGRITSFLRTVHGLTAGVHDWSGTVAFSYDTRGQLLTESFDADNGAPATDYFRKYTYDAYGNRRTVEDDTDDQTPPLETWDYTVNNQLDDPDYTYDSSGNPTEYAGNAADYDINNHLTDFGALDCTYRADGLRAKKVSGAGTSYYLYDGQTLLAEFAGNGTLTTINLWGLDGLVSRGDTLYCCDPLGNIVHRLDPTGAVTSSEVYDAWGNLLDALDPATGQPYQFGTDPYGYKGKFGYYTDRETGLILCGQRYYDPALGRWVTRDPIGTEGGINVYKYCNNNPVCFVDPSGLVAYYMAQTISIPTSSYSKLNIVLVSYSRAGELDFTQAIRRRQDGFDIVAIDENIAAAEAAAYSVESNAYPNSTTLPEFEHFDSKCVEYNFMPHYYSDDPRERGHSYFLAKNKRNEEDFKKAWKLHSSLSSRNPAIPGIEPPIEEDYQTYYIWTALAGGSAALGIRALGLAAGSLAVAEGTGTALATSSVGGSTSAAGAVPAAEVAALSRAAIVTWLMNNGLNRNNK